MESLQNPLIEVDKNTILLTAAEDGIFFGQHFFPKTIRQESAPFHPEMWGALESLDRYVAFMVFRGGAKTTIARLCVAKRVAYAISRTIFIVGESQDQAKRTTRWLRRQVLFNRKWAEFYRLKKGEKWTDDWLEIINEAEGITITVLAVGITGQIRGVNIDDFRPDFILADDPCDEENTGTPEQRKKTSDLFFGALAKTLAPPTEAPLAKLVLLQTILAEGDLVDSCSKDPEWKTLIFPCFDKNGKSTWPKRFPTEFLQKEKQAHVNRNQLPLWLREMECRVVSENSARLRPDWLKYWDDGILPEGGFTVMYIDPVPPPSDAQIARGLIDKDYEALSVIQYYKGNFYHCETMYNRGHDPDWTIMAFWTLVDKWRVRKCRVEPVGYQRTLKWILEKSMNQRRRWIQMDLDPRSNMKKVYKIVDALTPIASVGKFHTNKSFVEFISQWCAYPNVMHDDVLESVAGAAQLAQEEAMILDGEFIEVDDEQLLLEDRTSFGGFAP